MFTALLVGSAGPSSAAVRNALADAGCRDIETAALADVLASFPPAEGAPDLVIAFVDRHDLRALQQLTSGARDLPVLAICDDRTVEPAFLAGASDCVATPVRHAELVARVRQAIRGRLRARHRATRERRMSDAIEVLQREKHALERLVCVDALTGIANRRHALALLDGEWRRSLREHVPLGVVMIDLDCYHAYNEQYGHQGGDVCLQRVTDAMVRCLRRPSDVLGRYGGEEFVAVLPNTDAVGAKIVAERLRASVEALAIPHVASMCSRVVTITAGFASLRVTQDLSTDKLIATADAALLRAKSKGRNRIEGDAPLVRPLRVSAQRWERHAPVFADPWYADRIPAFLGEVEEAARSVLDAPREGDPTALAATAHDLMRSATALSLDLVATHAADLARAIACGDDARVRDLADELIQYANHVQVIYRRAPTVPPDVQRATAS